MLMSNKSRGVFIVAIVCSATAMCTGIGQYAFGYFIEPLEQTFGWSRTEISASLSFAAVTGLAAPFFGRAMDRYGARPILVISLTLCGLSLVLRPLMSELWHWYALSFLQFVAVAGATILPMGKLIGTWYPQRRGRVMAIGVMGNNFGGLIVPGLVAVVLTYATWREGFVAVGLLTWVIVLLAWWVVREEPEISPDDVAGAEARAALRGGSSVREAVRTRAFYVVLFVVTLGTFTYSGVLPHISSHLMNLGIDGTSATFALNGVAIGGIIGKLLFGFLAERIGPRDATVINLCGQTVFAIALGNSESVAALYILAPLFGVCMGGFGVLNALLVQETFGMAHYGSIMGLVNTGMVVSFGLGPLLAGISYDVSGSYAGGFTVVAMLFSVAALTLSVFHIPRYEGSA
ncbi:MAG: MFS transporter [Chromatiales bacterium]|jgi:MFS family permease|nr:MFS transporter [Chromatiales bacterium]